MGSYELNRLYNNEFENLVQALSTKIFNYENIIFGSGPDGAREATFEGNSVVDGDSFNGYHVIQAKYKECSVSADKKDWKWVSGELEKEIKKFEDKNRNLKTPDVYIFFTNIQFTSVSKTGGRDKIEEFKKKYLKLIPNIRIYGYDDICKFLDNNRDVATAYSSFILTGDILQVLYESIQVSNKKDQNILYRFLNKEFEEDLYSKLEQANELTDKKINLEKVFVDLNITGDNLSENNNEKFIDFCIKTGNKTWKNTQYKMVFIGGPGQGKSTVTQFLTQIYRVYFLNTFSEKKLSKHAENFRKYNVTTSLQPKCYRFPIRIILSDYSQWISDQKKDNLSYTVLSYIQKTIEYRADEEFDNFSSFRIFLEKLSFIFIFDGLDEVPSTSNRDVVLSQIDSFINHELTTISCDALIIATTRPQGYSNEFNQSNFIHFRLNDLDDETCMNYLENLVKNTVVSSDDRKKQLNILKDALNTEVTSNIMRTPLQATIMAILVKSGGKPSKDKFSLFNDYYHTMLKREKQKNVLKIIGEHEDYINEIHYRLGNKLQLSSQKQENSSALLDIDGFKSLVESYFTEQELEQKDKEKYTKEIMEAITERLVFITENQEGKIGFAIRSTQEYFSAMMNVHNRSDKDVIKNIRLISESIYWRNVFIFMLGYIAKNKDYLLDNLDSYINELNGSALPCHDTSISKITRYGSLLSLDILSESILSFRPKEENKFIKHLENLLDIVLPENIEHMLQILKPQIIENDMVEILINGVKSNELIKRINSWNIISILSENNKIFSKYFYDFLTKNEEEELYCLNLFIENNVYSEFILEKYFKYLNWNYYENIKQFTYDNKFMEALTKSKFINLNNEARFFIIEVLFLELKVERHYKEYLLHLFFNLLDIKTNSKFKILKEERTVLKEVKGYEFSIFKIKDLKSNKLLKDLYSATCQYNELSLLSSYFNYLLNPSISTLNKYRIEIKQKNNFKNLFNGLSLNWQLSYVHGAIENEFSDKQINETFEKWGKSINDFRVYEKKLIDSTNIFENIEFISIDKKQNLEKYTIDFINFYEYIYINNKSKLRHKLLLNLIIDSRSIKEYNNSYCKVIDEIILIIKNDKMITTQFRSLASISVVALVKKELLVDLISEYDILDNDYPRHLFSKYILKSVIENIINVVSLHDKQNILIKVLFNILIKESSFLFDFSKFNILYELEYSDMKLKTYGYLISLINPEIHNDSDKMKVISSFIIPQIQNDNTMIEYLLSIVMVNDLKGVLIENLLLSIYKCIDKNNIKNCILASKYENNFKNMFENKVIEFR